MTRCPTTPNRAIACTPIAWPRWQRFSASDLERLAAVLRMAQDPRVELVVAVRGGYGWSRILSRLDWPMLAASRKRWLGHSDFTAFQLAALARTRMVTFGGPLAAYDFGAEDPSAHDVLLEARTRCRSGGE